MKPGGAGGVPLRVLVFEDHEEDVEIALRTLRAGGFAVHADVVTTLEDVKHRLQADCYDVILSDYRMPQATGMDAFEVMKAEGRSIPFVLVTGSLGEERL